MRKVLLSILIIGVLIGAVAVYYYLTRDIGPGKIDEKYELAIKDSSVGEYHVVLLGASPIVKIALDGFKEKFNELATGGRVGVKYTELNIPLSESGLRDTVAFILENKVDLVVSAQSEIAFLAPRITHIPMISLLATDPVQLGFAKSEHGSGNNIVFIEVGASDLAVRRLGYFTELFPGAKNIIVIRGSQSMNYESNRAMEALFDYGQKHNLTITEEKFSSRENLEHYFQTHDFSSTDALFRYPSAFTAANVDLFFKYQERINKPIIGVTREELERGAVLAYSPKYNELGEIGASVAWQVLKGQIHPGLVPVQHPFSNELGINEKVLKSFGISIPDTFRARVDYLVSE